MFGSWSGRISKNDIEAVRRRIMHTESTLAETIYSEVFGHLDDKIFRARKVQEIHEWLGDEELEDNPSVVDLVAAWREYDTEDVAANPA